MYATDEIHTDVEGAGALGAIIFQIKQVAGLGIMSHPQGNAQDDTSCELQHTAK